MRLIIVEDDPMIARSLDNALSPLGNSVDAFSRLKDARAALRHDRFDLLLLDLGLPDGNGLELLSELRERGDKTPVLILTARDGIEDRVKGLDLGADDYLAKPFSLAELEARVRALLRRSQQRSDNRLMLGPLCLDPMAGTATLDGVTLALPRRQRDPGRRFIEDAFGDLAAGHGLRARGTALDGGLWRLSACRRTRFR